jgi:AcrR family transcriptional regulator
MYAVGVPRLWNATIEAHRHDVRQAVIDTTAALIAEHGLLSVTMSRIAEETGIGRATLYKYYPDVESILIEWHERQIAAHLSDLTQISDRGGDSASRLRAVLEGYALITNESASHHDSEVSTLIHHHEQVAKAEHQLRHLVQGLIADAAKDGAVRSDVPPQELAVYCLNALGAARSLPSKAAVRRLVTLTLNGLQSPN